MSSPKSLSAEQISRIQAWADSGDGFPEIQKKLRDELAIRIAYCETRFLLEDLKIELLPTPEPEPEPEVAADALVEGDEAAPADDSGAGGAKVSVDTVLRPGAIISGRVDFGGGKTAAWWLDQMGRLGMDASDPTFRPDEAQMIAFQSELRKVIQKSGL